MILYKLTDEHGQTKNNTQWGVNVTHTASGAEGQPLCSDGWIHAYTHPFLAVLLNPIHANFQNPQLWEANGEIGINDHLKCGCRTLTTIKVVVPLKITIEQAVRFAIACAWPTATIAWRKWAKAWLQGDNRSAEAAAEAEAAAAAAAAEAAAAAAEAAAEAEAAAWAAAAAVWAAANLNLCAEWAINGKLIGELYSE